MESNYRPHSSNAGHVMQTVSYYIQSLSGRCQLMLAIMNLKHFYPCMVLISVETNWPGN